MRWQGEGGSKYEKIGLTIYGWLPYLASTWVVASPYTLVFFTIHIWDPKRSIIVYPHCVTYGLVAELPNVVGFGSAWKSSWHSSSSSCWSIPPIKSNFWRNIFMNWKHKRVGSFIFPQFGGIYAIMDRIILHSVCIKSMVLISSHDKKYRPLYKTCLIAIEVGSHWESKTYLKNDTSLMR